MLKISKKLSVALSLVITILCLVLLTAAGATAYNYPVFWLRLRNVKPDLGIVLFTYGELLIAYGAVGLLLALLNRIRHQEIFTAANVSLLRALSWFSFAEALLFTVEAILRPNGGMVLVSEPFRNSFLFLFGAVAFVFVFVGLILRVVKNALEEAVAIKTEQDYTI